MKSIYFAVYTHCVYVLCLFLLSFFPLFSHPPPLCPRSHFLFLHLSLPLSLSLSRPLSLSSIPIYPPFHSATCSFLVFCLLSEMSKLLISIEWFLATWFLIPKFITPLPLYKFTNYYRVSTSFAAGNMRLNKYFQQLQNYNT